MYERLFIVGKCYPGIRTTRSFGNLIAHSIGVNCKPNIVYFNDIKMFRKIVFATDGFWDVFEDKRQVFSTFFNYGDDQDSLHMAIDDLLQQAWKNWMKIDPCNIDSMSICMMDIN